MNPFLIVLIIFSIEIFFIIIRKKTNSKKENYRIKGTAFITIGIVIMSIFIILSYNDDTDKSKTSNVYTIEEYNIKLNVSETNKVSVKEEILVKFNKENQHGIYKIIPYWLEYTGNDNKTISKKAKITNLKAIGDEYKIDNIKGKKRIKIGDKTKTRPTGYYTYEIQYDYDMGSDPYEGYDEFIFHAFGDYWDTPIKNATVELTMPTKINPSKIKLFTDKYRKTDLTNTFYIYTEENSNTVYIETPDYYNLTHSLTIDYLLEDGYFKNANNNYGFISFTLCIIIVILSMISFYFWKKKGKDFEFTETVEFYPPNQLDAAEIGYIYKQTTGKKLTIALIVELASKGCIQINDTKEQLVIKKRISTDKIVLTSNELLVYENLFKNGDEIDLKKDPDFYWTFDKVNRELPKQLDEKINDTEAYKTRLTTSTFFLISVILWILGYAIIKDLNPNYKILYTISFIAIIVTLIFTILMKRKNKYGEEITTKINGFKNYLVTAEKNQLELLTQQNANYFYDILPYAYVLDVSKKWIEKFEEIKVPNNEIGNFDFNNIDTLGSEIYIPSSGISHSSSSSCGGGCSSCGGGCSSCGGGGSW